MITCNICGKQENNKKFSVAIAEDIRKKELCFSCLFWKAKVSIRDRLNVARIDGDHFIINESDTISKRGYNGQEFTIKFFDGREVTTTNLWHQGKIPEHFRKFLPDNAEFKN